MVLSLTSRSAPGNIELRHIRYFLTIVEEMNFGRAAERLNIAQPGLSQQIKALENILGATLIDRSRRQMQLTLAGEIFAKEAAKVLAQVDVAARGAVRAARGEVGRLAVGYVGSAAFSGVLHQVVGDYRRQHPMVELDIADMEMVRQIEALADGRLDIAFIRPPIDMPEEIATLTLLQEELLIALPASHPMAARDIVTLASLRDETFVIPQHAPRVSFHRHTTVACQAAGFEPKLGPRGHDFLTIISIVSVGLGIALVPRSVSNIRAQGVTFRPLADVSPKAELSVAYRRSDTSPVVRGFINATRQLLKMGIVGVAGNS
jgi:DNA-binding transcriptional LysR family regulator